MKRTVLVVAVLFVTASALLYFYGKWALLIFGVVLCVAASLCAILRHKYNLGLVSVFVLSAGALYCLGLLLFFVPHIQKIESLDSTNMKISVRVIEEPEARGDNVLLLVKSYGDDRKLEPIGEKVKFYLYYSVDSEAAQAKEGDIINAEVHFSALPDTSKRSWMGEGVFISAYSGSAEIVGHKESFYTKIIALRRSIKSAVYRYADGDDAALIKGLLLGGTYEMSDELYSQFKICGVSHICAVSGMHIGSFCMMSVTLLGLFMRRRKASLLALIPLALVCLLSGLTPSAIRSGIMCAVTLIGIFLFKKSDSMNSLGLAVALMLVCNPYYILSLSFQLSCCAAAGVILITPYAMNIASKIPETGKLWVINRIASAAVLNLIQSVGAVLCTLPIQIAEFGRVSLISPIAAVLISAAAVYTMGAAALGVLLTFIPFVRVAAILPFSVAVLFAKYIRTVVAALSKIPFASVPVSQDGALLWIATVMVIFAVWLCFTLPFKRWVAVVLAAALLSVSLGTEYITSQSVVQTAVLDTGRGFCTVMSKGRSCIVFGCGDDKADGYALSAYLKTNGISTVEALFIPSEKDVCFGGYESVVFATQPKVTVVSSTFSATSGLMGKVLSVEDGRVFTYFDNAVSVEVLCDRGGSVYGVADNDSLLLIGCSEYTVGEKYSSVDALLTAGTVPKNVKAGLVAIPSGINLKFVAESVQSDRLFVATEGAVVLKSKKGKGLVVYAR